MAVQDNDRDGSPGVHRRDAAPLELKIISYHAGAMVLRVANRLRSHYQHLPGVISPDDLELPSIEYLQAVLDDTVTQGSRVRS